MKDFFDRIRITLRDDTSGGSFIPSVHILL